MRIHVLGVPHTQTTEEFSTCAFTQKTLNLCKMLHVRGHNVIHYGVEGGSPVCSENVSVMPKEFWKPLFGHPGRGYYNISTDGRLAPYHALFAKNLKSELQKHVGHPYTEIVCQTWGGAQKTACEGLPQFLVESGIGYPISWADWRVYESYAWMHMHLGRDQLFGGAKWYWAVIPNAFDIKNFEPQKKRGDDFLYLGRLNDDKGVGIAIEAAKEAGRKITLVGQGNAEPFLKGNPHASYLPPVGIEERKRLLANAHAVFCPTIFVEPFCGVNVEAQLSGTPVITSDHGVFPETVLHGVTGWRCRTFEQFVWAAKNVDKLSGAACREWATKNYSLERVALMYEEFFQQILNVRDHGGRKVIGPTGFYEKHPGRTQLDWLKKIYPVNGLFEQKLDLKRPHEAPVIEKQPSHEEWLEAQKFESAWWGTKISPRWKEEVQKQKTYFRLMGASKTNFGSKTILDIGCGPVSRLLRTEHGPSRGVDPLPMAEETRDLFWQKGIELLSCPAENMPLDRTFDEVWIYNCLQHVRDPEKILERASLTVKNGGCLRLFEWINHGVSPGHPQNLTEDLFEKFFQVWEKKIWNTGTLNESLAQGSYLAMHVTKPHGLSKETP